MNKISNNSIISYIDVFLLPNIEHGKTANHFYNLKNRLINGRKLTPKMIQNVGWIKEEIIKLGIPT